MTPTQRGQEAANNGKARPVAGSDKASQEAQRAYDEQQAKNAAKKNGGKS